MTQQYDRVIYFFMPSIWAPDTIPAAHTFPESVRGGVDSRSIFMWHKQYAWRSNIYPNMRQIWPPSWKWPRIRTEWIFFSCIPYALQTLFQRSTPSQRVYGAGWIVARFLYNTGITLDAPIYTPIWHKSGNDHKYDKSNIFFMPCICAPDTIPPACTFPESVRGGVNSHSIFIWHTHDARRCNIYPIWEDLSHRAQI